jgi:hypothetical protein
LCVKSGPLVHLEHRGIAADDARHGPELRFWAALRLVLADAAGGLGMAGVALGVFAKPI